MAKGLNPSFVRIGGVGTNAVYFGKQFGVNGSTVSESQWDSVNDFAKKTGLNIIASLNPTIRSQEAWDSQNSEELISYSNKKDYDVVWQLGYDSMAYRSNGLQLGRDLNALKKILEDNLKYSNLPVFAPDITSLNGAKQIRFIKELLTNNGNILGSIVLQPQFSKADANEDPYDAISSMTNELDTYIWNKEVRIGRAIPRKPIWIAESSPSQGTFKEAMKLTKRLGAAARSGVQVYLRQAGVATLKSPTPDFWVALLYKNLVGQGVLESKIISGNETRLHTFSHCTPSIPQERSVLDTDWNYEKGAVTIFGVNESPETIKMSLKATNRDEPLHIYVLTSDKIDIPSSGKPVATLLNGQELQLSPTWDLPVLSPRVKRPNKTTMVTLPGESIFFIIMPDTNVRSCSVTPISTPDINLSDLTKRFRYSTTKKEATLQDDEANLDDDITSGGVYVSFTKKKRHDPDSGSNQKADIGKSLMKTLMSKLAPKKIETTTGRPIEPEMPVKYITFNENSFLSKLAEGIKEEVGSDDEKKTPKYGTLTDTIAISKLDTKGDEDIPVGVVGNSNSKTESTDEVSDASIATPESYSALSRTRRASNEEIPSPLTRGYASKQSVTLKELTDSMKSEKSATEGNVGDVLKKLRQVEVTYKSINSDEIADKARCARDITSSTSEEDSSEERPSKTNAEKVDDEEDAKTTELMKIVEETEKVQNVSDCKDSLVVPPNITQEKLDQVMLETAKSKSEAEPDGENDKEEPIKRENVPLQTEDKQDENPTQEPIGTTPAAEEVTSVAQPCASNQQPPVLPVNEQPSNLQILPMNPTKSENALNTHNLMNTLNRINPMNVPSINTMNIRSFNPMNVPNINTMTIQNPNNPMNVRNDNPTNILNSNPMHVPNINPMNIVNPNDLINVPNMNPMSILNPNYPMKVPNVELMNIPNMNSMNILNTNEPNINSMSNINPKNPMNVPNMNPMVVLNPNNPVNTPNQMSLPMTMNPANVASRPVPIYNEKKEEAINSILSRIITKEDAKLKNLPVEVIRTDGIEKDSDDLVSVNLSTNDTIMMSKSDAKMLDQEKIEEVEPLENGPQFDLIDKDDEPKIKVSRQIVTPLPRTATLASPVQPQMTPNPTGPVSPIKTPMVAVSSEERLKSLQKKMEDLRSQYAATRAKRLEEIKKQVALASSYGSPGTDAEQTIKNTIKRREAELKEWFKKFDKREAEAPSLSRLTASPGVADNVRPRRLSLFHNDDTLESLIDEDLSDSYNQKRSTESKTSSQNQVQNKPPETQPQIYSLRKMRDAMGKYLFPLDEKTHGIVYNNKIYPAKLYGFIEGAPLPGKQTEDEDSLTEIDDSDKYTEVTTVRPESTREKLAVVPKEAFMKEITSEFIPVVIVPPGQLDESLASDESSITRNKRSTLSEFEDRFQQIKDDLLPKITSFVKTLSDNPPWRRDLDRSSRMRRSVDELIRTNDLRSLLHHPKAIHLRLSEKPKNISEIEDYVIGKVDKAENELFKLAKQHTVLAEQVGQGVLNGKVERKDESTADIQYCEEIGTPTKSVIRDPFEFSSKGSKVDGLTQSAKDQMKLSEEETSKLSQSSTNVNTDRGNKFIDAMFASAIEEKFTQFLDTIKHLIGLSSESKD